jgi:hypothetical protein
MTAPYIDFLSSFPPISIAEISMPPNDDQLARDDWQAWQRHQGNGCRWFQLPDDLERASRDQMIFAEACAHHLQMRSARNPSAVEGFSE